MPVFFVLHFVAALFWLEAHGEELLFTPVSGVFARASIAMQPFEGVYRQSIDTWHEMTSLSDRPLTAVSPITGKVIACHTT